MGLLSSLVKWGHTRHYNAGILHFNRGEFARAVECFEAVLEEVRDPNDPDHCLARVHAAEARGNLGLAHFHAGDYVRAEAEFTRALEENPTFPDLRYYRARIFERSGRIDEAIDDLERALDEHPHYLEGHLLLAVCLGLQGDRDRSARELAEALELGFDAPEWVTPAVVRDWTGEQWRRLLPGGAEKAGEAGDARPLDRALARQQAGDLEGANRRSRPRGLRETGLRRLALPLRGTALRGGPGRGGDGPPEGGAGAEPALPRGPPARGATRTRARQRGRGRGPRRSRARGAPAVSRPALLARARPLPRRRPGGRGGRAGTRRGHEPPVRAREPAAGAGVPRPRAPGRRPAGAAARPDAGPRSAAERPARRPAPDGGGRPRRRRGGDPAHAWP